MSKMPQCHAEFITSKTPHHLKKKASKHALKPHISCQKRPFPVLRSLVSIPQSTAQRWTHLLLDTPTLRFQGRVLPTPPIPTQAAQSQLCLYPLQSPRPRPLPAACSVLYALVLPLPSPWNVASLCHYQCLQIRLYILVYFILMPLKQSRYCLPTAWLPVPVS